MDVCKNSQGSEPVLCMSIAPPLCLISQSNRDVQLFANKTKLHLSIAVQEKLSGTSNLAAPQNLVA